MQDEQIAVLLVGGGPTGLAASLFLSRLGISSLVVERHSGTAIHPKARGINYRTVELLRLAGLEEKVREAGAALASSRTQLMVESLAGREIRRFGGFEQGEMLQKLERLTPTVWCFCAQDALEPILLEAALAQGGKAAFNTELIEFEQDETGVTARVREQKSGQERLIKAAYMIAADGANSPIRQKLGIGMSGRGTISYYLGIYFKADLSELIKNREFITCFVQNPAVKGLIASVNNHDRWVLNAEYDSSTPPDFSPAHCLELVRSAVGLPELEAELISIQPWEAAVKSAENYQQGRIFLAGDAVHVMPPAGAFGLNTGIQDAHNLAWKLAMVLKGQASPGLLDTYNAERQPVGQFTVEQAGLRVDRRNAGGAASAKFVDDLAIIFGVRYNSKAVISPEELEPPSIEDEEAEQGGYPGTRAPHIWLEKTGKRISTIDLFDGRFVLLVGSEGASWQAATRNLAGQLGLELEIYQLGHELKDLDNRWLSAYKIQATGAVLIRPDGFVGWRSPENVAEPELVLELVLKTLLQKA